MTVEISIDGTTYENATLLEGAPAVSLSGTGITFVNLSDGVARPTAAFQPAIRLAQGGNTIINRSGATIMSFAVDQTVISGSSGNDTLDNGGMITGLVFLAGGSDTYVRRITASEGGHSIDLGDGDDTAQYFYSPNAPQGNYAAPSISGAGGNDTIEMSGPIWGFDASNVTGFEKLVLLDGGIVTQNISNLSGLSEITLSGTNFVNLIGSYNPNAQVTLNGNWISLQSGSAVGAVTGSASADAVWLVGSGSVLGAIEFGGGDDELRLQFTADSTPGISHPVSGGEGVDYLLLEAFGLGLAAQFDLSNVSDFEVLTTHWHTGTEDSITVTGATGFTFVIGDGARASLTINNSNLPQAHSFSGGRSTFTVGTGTAIGDYGVYTLNTLPARDLVALASQTAANPLENRNVLNSGTILGDVNLGVGNDLYDGQSGSIGGIVRAFAGDDVLIGGSGAERFDGGDGADRLTGGFGNDTLTGGSNVDTAVFSGNRAAFTITQTSTGVFQLVGPDGTDILTTVEYAQFADQTLRLLPGTGVAVDFNAPASTWMGSIRDFDGNNLGAASRWKLIGSADVDGDGDLDRIVVNREIGRFAEVATGPDGLVYFSDHSWAGETRVVGIYIDPEVVADPSKAGGPFDSQRRFQNDLFIDNIAGVLGAGDYDRDGLQEVYFKLTDGTAYLHAYMHADGNIRYANYQSQQQVIDFLTANGWTASTWAGWFPSGAEAPKAAGFESDSFGFDEIELASLSPIYTDDGMARWAEDHFAMQPLV